MARGAVSGMGLTPGFNNVEVIVSHDDDQPYFIEVNGGRCAAQDMNIVASGVNMMDLLVETLTGETITPIDHVPDGKAILKIRRDVVVDFASIQNMVAP